MKTKIGYEMNANRNLSFIMNCSVSSHHFLVYIDFFSNSLTSHARYLSSFLGFPIVGVMRLMKRSTFRWIWLGALIVRCCHSWDSRCVSMSTAIDPKAAWSMSHSSSTHVPMNCRGVSQVRASRQYMSRRNIPPPYALNVLVSSGIRRNSCGGVWLVNGKTGGLGGDAQKTVQVISFN